MGIKDEEIEAIKSLLKKFKEGWKKWIIKIAAILKLFKEGSFKAKNEPGHSFKNSNKNSKGHLSKINWSY